MIDLERRVNALLDMADLSGRAFAIKVGANPQQIYDILRGKIRKFPTKLADKIVAVYPKINKTWMLTGEGPMYKDDSVEKTNNTPEGIWIPPELAQMFSDMAATIRSQQADLHELRAFRADNKKTAAGL